MIHVLEKENLGDPAQALHDLGSLIKDKVYIILTCPCKLMQVSLCGGSYEPLREKTCLLVSDQVPHKPGCTATEDG